LAIGDSTRPFRVTRRKKAAVSLEITPAVTPCGLDSCRSFCASRWEERWCARQQPGGLLLSLYNRFKPLRKPGEEIKWRRFFLTEWLL
jgi:hypothetical protein